MLARSAILICEASSTMRRSIAEVVYLEAIHCLYLINTRINFENHTELCGKSNKQVNFCEEESIDCKCATENQNCSSIFIQASVQLFEIRMNDRYLLSSSRLLCELSSTKKPRRVVNREAARK